MRMAATTAKSSSASPGISEPLPSVVDMRLPEAQHGLDSSQQRRGMMYPSHGWSLSAFWGTEPWGCLKC